MGRGVSLSRGFASCLWFSAKIRQRAVRNPNLALVQLEARGGPAPHNTWMELYAVEVTLSGLHVVQK